MVEAVDEVAASITAVVAAVADGVEMPDVVSFSEEPASGTTASVAATAIGAAATAAAAAAAKT